MKNERRRIKELNRLSAYLDNALEAKEVEKLQMRLAQEPDLREKLENLRRTKLLLSQLNRIRAPRDYTLKPDMVKVRGKGKQPLFTTLRLATSFAAILLVALFGLQLLLPGGIQPASLQSEAPMMESAERSDQTTPEPLIFWTQPGMGGAGAEGIGGGAGDTMAEEPEMYEEAPQEPDEEEQAPLESPDVESAPSHKNLEESSPILGINPEQSGEILQRSEPTNVEQEISSSWTEIIKWVQAGLAVIVLGGGLTLWILYRKR